MSGICYKSEILNGINTIFRISFPDTCFESDRYMLAGRIDEFDWIEDVPNAIACQLICQQNYACEYFFYRNKNKVCELIQKPGVTIKQISGTVGPKYCNVAAAKTGISV